MIHRNDNTPSVHYKEEIDRINIEQTTVWNKGSVPSPTIKTTMLIPGPEFKKKIDGGINIFSFTETPPSSYLSKYDVSLAQDNSAILYGCSEKTGFNQYFYSDCDVVYLNPNCYRMFMQCGANYLTLSPKFDTSKVETMEEMFESMPRVQTTLDLSNWDTSKVTNMKYMFYSFGNGHYAHAIYGPKFVHTAVQNLTLNPPTQDSGAFHMMLGTSIEKPEWNDGIWTEYGDFIQN